MNGGKTAWALVGTAAVIGLVALPVAYEPVRLLYAVAFCLLVPGAGWAYRAGSADAADKLAIAVLISLSATILVATAMVATNSWSLPGGVAALLVVAALGLVPYRQIPGGSQSRKRS